MAIKRHNAKPKGTTERSAATSDQVADHENLNPNSTLSWPQSNQTSSYVGKNNERRNADAARILQVVEAYCASAWTQLSCRSLDPSKGANPRVCSGVLSPAESKTLLQQFMAPSLISSQTRSGSKHPTDSASSEIPLSSKVAPGKSSGLSASAIVRSVAKRSGSTKQKSESVVVPSDGARPNTAQLATTTGPTPVCHPVASSDVAGSSSVVQSFSPPPVILPTRGGRRL
ncbi:unnamed protein product [Echinostoma caproni]|uniref:Uncharacterized protein n=1 Tax=Echinostoma caproni TaxID=27848 RepID=A0A183AB80_9TREM|nr:unnamed protein product [Echinostoma caproni]